MPPLLVIVALCVVEDKPSGAVRGPYNESQLMNEVEESPTAPLATPGEAAKLLNDIEPLRCKGTQSRYKRDMEC